MLLSRARALAVYGLRVLGITAASQSLQAPT
jgi:hypothetical protein